MQPAPERMTFDLSGRYRFWPIFIIPYGCFRTRLIFTVLAQHRSFVWSTFWHDRGSRVSLLVLQRSRREPEDSNELYASGYMAISLLAKSLKGKLMDGEVTAFPLLSERVTCVYLDLLNGN